MGGAAVVGLLGLVKLALDFVNHQTRRTRISRAGSAAPPPDAAGTPDASAAGEGWTYHPPAAP